MSLFDKVVATVAGGTPEEFADFKRRHKRAKKHGLTVAEYDALSKEQRDRLDGHTKGFGDPVHASINGQPVTAAYGWGGNEGEVELVDGHVDLASFWQRTDRNHYGNGNGPNNNVKDRGGYTGPGA